MSIHEFRSLIPVTTPLGSGYALWVETDEHDNYWSVILDSGAVVEFVQEQIKVWKSYTHGRNMSNTDMLRALQPVRRSIFPLTEETCTGHIASPIDPKICDLCGTHIDSLR